MTRLEGLTLWQRRDRFGRSKRGLGSHDKAEIEARIAEVRAAKIARGEQPGTVPTDFARMHRDLFDRRRF